MNNKRMGWSFAAATALLAGLWCADAWARNTITSPAGCSQEFKGNKDAIKACQACTRDGGHYKQDAHKKTWSCQK